PGWVAGSSPAMTTGSLEAGGVGEPVPKDFPVPSTCGIIPPSPHRSEIMTSGWCGGTARTGGELRAVIRNFALPAPTRRTGEAEPQLFADYPLRGESLAGAASHGQRRKTAAQSGRHGRAGGFGAPTASVK